VPNSSTNPPQSGRLQRSPPVIAIVGATGAVGRELLRVLEGRDFPVAELRLYASPRSAGMKLPFHGQEITVAALSGDSFTGVDLALFSAGSKTAREFAPAATRAGAVVVDNSSAFRMDPDVPLAVPEINPAEITRQRGIIANPNCTAIVSLMALWPIHRRNPIRRAIISTYQAASGGGAAAMLELQDATRAALDGRAYLPRVLPHPYAFNLFSHNTPIDVATGYNEEETKVMNEMRKILGMPELRIGVTCIRVPILRAHAVALTVECERPISAEGCARLDIGCAGCAAR
jgi:aspartate-semialdehyde dehydrogenase